MKYEPSETATHFTIKRPDYAELQPGDTTYQLGGRYIVIFNDPMKGKLRAVPIENKHEGLNVRVANDTVFTYRKPGTPYTPTPDMHQLSHGKVVSTPMGFKYGERGHSLGRPVHKGAVKLIFDNPAK